MSLFHLETMQHVSLFMRFDDAPMVAVVLAESAFFDPSRANYKDKQLPDTQGISYRRIFQHSLTQWQSITKYLQLTPEPQVNRLITVNKQQLVDIEKQLNKIWTSCTAHKETARQLDEQLHAIQHLFALLAHFKHLDIDLSLLHRDFEFLDVRLGIIPLPYISRLKEALGIEGYYLSVYTQEEDSAHVIIAGIKKDNDDIQALLDSASFQSLHIPDEFHQQPKTVYATLSKKQQKLNTERQQHKQKWFKLQQGFAQQIYSLGDSLALAKPYAILSKKMLRNGQLIQVNGWIPKKKITQVQTALNKHMSNPVVMESRDPRPEEYAQTPSYLLHPQWLRPFLKLVNNYGIANYREFDPSYFFTLTYILMFGLMFGDVGHGACIIAFSWYIKKKWPDFSLFFLFTGFSSLCFGFIYGSIFCYEHLLPSLWLSPMEHPLLMLKLALYWGAGFIIVLNIISIYNHFRSLQFKDALLNSRGVSGLLLYIAILWSLFDLSHKQFSNLNVILLLLPLLIIFIHQWTKTEGAPAERFLVSLFETYDVIISYVSNTLSFLRVAAFALNHSALAIALLTLAATTHTATAHWFSIVFGNLFILVLEGVIVAIQVLRLEYYEGFSRFFTANGYLFKPLELSPQKLTTTEKM